MLKHNTGYDSKVMFMEREKLTPENFCYWLQGYIEIQRATGQPIVITDKEVKVIEEHLNLIFNKKVTVPVKGLGGVKLGTGEPMYIYNSFLTSDTPTLICN